MVMWTMSDRALPLNFAHMEGFGVNTYKFRTDVVSTNAKGTSGDKSPDNSDSDEDEDDESLGPGAVLVKFHFKPVAGLASMTWSEVQTGAGRDCDAHRRHLYETIDNGGTLEWTMGVQVLPGGRRRCLKELGIDPLDATKLIPEELVPIRELGRLVLDRNPENFFAETEQVRLHMSISQAPTNGFQFIMLNRRRFHKTPLKLTFQPHFVKLRAHTGRLLPCAHDSGHRLQR